MPALTVAFAEVLADAALSRLRAATAAGGRLQGVYIPPTRQQEVPAGTLSSLYCSAVGERGEGKNQSLPQFMLTATLHIVGSVAQGRESPTNIDLAMGALVQTVFNVLLEDPTFLALFAYVAAYNWEKSDPPTGKDAEEYDGLYFRIELELVQWAAYTPVYNTPLQVIDVKTTIGDVSVEAEINLPQ